MYGVWVYVSVCEHHAETGGRLGVHRLLYFSPPYSLETRALWILTGYQAPAILLQFPASHAGVTGTYKTTPGTYSQHTTGAEAELRPSCLHNKHAHPPSHLPIQHSFILWRMLLSLSNSICGDSWAEFIRAMITLTLVRGRVLVLDLVTTACFFYRGEQHFRTSFLSAKKIHA